MTHYGSFTCSWLSTYIKVLGVTWWAKNSHILVRVWEMPGPSELLHFYNEIWRCSAWLDELYMPKLLQKRTDLRFPLFHTSPRISTIVPFYDIFVLYKHIIFRIYLSNNTAIETIQPFHIWNIYIYQNHNNLYYHNQANVCWDILSCFSWTFWLFLKNDIISILSSTYSS